MKLDPWTPKDGVEFFYHKATPSIENNVLFILFKPYFIKTLHKTSNLIIHILLINFPN